MFKNITVDSGIDYAGISYGVAWGDYDNDGNIDLWINNHGNKATLYRNQGDETFIDVTLDVFGNQPLGDFHGAAWADFDNDGDADLIQLIGADVGNGSLTDTAIANQFYVNDDGVLADRSLEFGLGYIGSRGRNPLWFDYNNDGLLDLLQGAGERPDGEVPATIFVQKDNFADIRPELNFDFGSNRFGILSDLVGDNTPELILSNPFTGISVYDSSTIADISNEVLDKEVKAKDFISEDFNGDLLPDLYLTKNGLSDSAFVTPNSRIINFNFNAEANQKGISFKTTGKITLDLWAFGFSVDEINLEDIFIGASGLSPQDLQPTLETDQDSTITELTLTLDPEDTRLSGLAAFNPGQDEGLYLGYDSASAEWQISLSTADKDLVAGIIESETAIVETEPIGFRNDLTPNQDQLLINNGSQLIDQTANSGLNTVQNAGINTVAGDFDNDMDIDLYVVNANAAGNEPNILYDNQGDGTFIMIENLGDAVGSKFGIGDSVTTNDYNNDGFLDLFVTNGEFPHLLVENTPYELLKNEGNDNHWLQIDLEGVNSNRDGIGAKVYVTAGNVTQLRQQSGGMHDQVQNDSRLHFGLADNIQADEIRIEWASGTVQTLENIASDQILTISESV